MHWPTSQGTWEEKKKRKKPKQNKPILNKWQYNGENKCLDSNKEETLVELWQQQPCLYDVFSSCYRDCNNKDVAWKQIAEK